MSELAGVYTAFKKDGSKYYRSSITYNSKHISLGSFSNMESAHNAYLEASDIINSDIQTIITYSSKKNTLSFDKWVCLINFRDNKIYFKTPIYLRKNYFSYYLSPKEELKFAIDDLFYYSSHKIMQRKGHLFVSDYGMQVNILSRYGIKNYAVAGKDYLFANNDPYDYRYENIVIVNQYYGVERIQKNNKTLYQTKIHIKGNYLVGTYSSEAEAAIAYNKAVDILSKKGINKNYQTNFILELTGKQYAEIYNDLKISKKLQNLTI